MSIKVNEYEFPKDLYYSEDHLWVRVLPDGIAVIGIDDFGAKKAGEIEFVEVSSEVGSHVKKGELLIILESGKWVGRLKSPVSGEIIEINSKVIEEDPTLINKDPYGEGWLVKIKLENLDEIKNLIHGEDAIKQWIKKEIEKYG